MEKIRQSNIQKEYDMEAKRLMVENVKVNSMLLFFMKSCLFLRDLDNNLKNIVQQILSN